MKYRVTWEVDVDGKSPIDAALEALVIQRDRESIATVFGARSAKSDDPVVIDLGEMFGETLPHALKAHIAVWKLRNLDIDASWWAVTEGDGERVDYIALKGVSVLDENKVSHLQDVVMSVDEYIGVAVRIARSDVWEYVRDFVQAVVMLDADANVAFRQEPPMDPAPSPGM